MALKMVLLKYSFLFKQEDNLWNRLSDFETDLADFFAANGLEAESLLTVEGMPNDRMLLIKKIETAAPVLENTKGVNLDKGPMLPLKVANKQEKSSQTTKRLTAQLGKSFPKEIK